MKKYIYFVLALFLVSCGSEKSSTLSSNSPGDVSSKTASVQSLDGKSYKEGELLVKFKAGVTAADSLKAHKSTSAALVKKIKLVPGLEHVTLPKSQSVSNAVEQYMSDPNVEYAEPNYLVHIDSTIPNDIYFDRQWSLRNIGIIGDGTPGADIQATDAWDISTGSSNIVIAVVDTGIDYNHADLVGNIWTNPDEIANNGIDDDLNGLVDDWRGWDFYNNDNDPFDDHGHGTHVAGTIGAVGNNSEGVAGLMWKVQLMPLKFLSEEGAGTTADSINAIDYAVENGAKIMNASYGGSFYSQAEADAINAANNAGVLLVAAAGNSSANNDINPHYPASYNLPNIISVAATDQNDMRISFSNFGPQSVDVAAPGVYIFSTTPMWWNDYPGYGSLEFFAGTSMAAPHVSGLAGLLYSYYSHFNYLQIRGTVLRYVDVLPSLQGWIQTNGRINAYMALSSLLTPTNLYATGISSSGISLMWTDHATGEDGYRIERSVSGGGFVEIAAMGQNSASYSDSNGINSVNSYTYRIKAYNTIPADSSYSTMAIVPAAPGDLSASAVSEDGINLAWADNSNNEAGFKIERKKVSQAPYTDNDIASEYQEVASVGANVTVFSDTGLEKATYYYRVKAFTATGISAPSNEAGAEITSRGGGGGCSIGTRQNTPTAMGNIAVLMLPAVIIAVLRRRKT